MSRFTKQHRLSTLVLQRFARDTRGAVAIIFAVSLIVLVGVAGGAVDFGYAYSQKSRLQSAIDAAAFAAARMQYATTSDRQTQALAVFRSNFPEHAAVSVSLNVVNEAVHITALKTHDTALLKAVGIPTLPIQAVAEVPLLKSGKAEVVLVLDYSDSMISADKYIRMRDAAQLMIDTITDNGKNKNVKFGVVPFAAMVQADLSPSFVRSDVVYNGCTQDRRYPYNTQEQAGTGGDDSKWGEITSTHACTDMASRGLKVVPLTSDVALVKSKIAAMQPYMWTHIALGADFGWQVLSPSGAFPGATSYSDSETVKVFVLLTDGMQTAPGWGPSNSQTTADAEANLKSICGGMKSKNIMVFTVGYDLSDTHTLDLLKDCANPGNFYNATDISTGLLASFSAIAKQVQEKMLRLTK